jgi:L-rhamnose-H+ transport protein
LKGLAIWGFLIVLIAGLLNGSFVVPMKRMRSWKWENTWLVYSVVSLLVVPWAFAWITVPHLGHLLSIASPGALLKVLLFGLGWGIGSVLFGLGVTMLGLGLGYGIILGIIATVGSLLPFVILHPGRIWTPQGYALFGGMILVIAGIAFCATAGRIRERSTASEAGTSRIPFIVGLIICILAGFFSAMLNFGFVFGAPMQQQAIAAGIPPSMAANGLWAVILTAGFVANGTYSAYMLTKNRTWHLFALASVSVAYWLGGSLMGVLCFASFVVYGMGAIALGPLGAIVGWPLLMSMSLMTANGWGYLTGEWQGASRKSYLYSLVGVAVLIVAIVVISFGNR